ncbi:MAG: GH3 auxin-responsive promoter family protein [Chitinophagales bacterium]|nr:GH3 auxin-responsive promoter family protein [Chitinophagales bacterium]
MSLRSIILKPIANFTKKRLIRSHSKAVSTQRKTLKKILRKARNTSFGKDHSFDDIKSYDDFKSKVPVRDYEELKSYFDRMVEGEKDVLWPGQPKYLAKTSGTTSGSKFIPISHEAISHFIKASWNALMCYIADTGKADFFDGKMIFLQGSPEMEKMNGMEIGRLSGIVYHHVPAWLHRNRLPSYKINCTEDWEEKVEKIVHETLDHDLRLISGIPPWIIMYFERLLEVSDKKSIQEVFPDFKLFVHGGVNYQPYKNKIERLTGFPVDSIETYPASEGFIAYQDSLSEEGLLLNLDAGIFYEFVPLSEYFEENPKRLSLEEVELDQNYALILSSNSGLWGYSIGDTVKFTSLNPYRLKVSGRVKHFLSAFGEHVIAEEVERAMLEICEKFRLKVTEYTVAPKVEVEGELPYHEWFVEFSEQINNLEEVALALDESMCRQNSYYKDLIEGKVLQKLKINNLGRDVFKDYMRLSGKLGGQNKVARLSNDRRVAEGLEKVMLQKT